MATIEDFGIERGEVFLSSFGIWTADLVPLGDAVLSEGQRVTIVVGDLSLSGTIVAGAVLADSSGVRVVGGAGGWRKSIARKAYRDNENGVKLASVVADLARETGETVDVADSLRGAVLGAAWTRPEGTAAEALDVLGKPWRVRPDGVTELGPLATRQASGIVSLRSYAPGHRRAIVEFPDDEVSSVLPGTVLDLAEDLSLTVRTATITITSGTIRGRIVGT